MPNVIRELSKSMINKIAAGEVIERPANVVKELMENSVDAGATRIDVDIKESGVEEIRITDNGCGIPADQIRLALSPHCTSKISSDEDLAKIGTLGFRGEALASIAEVSQLTLTSRDASSLEGAKVECQDGKQSEPVPVGRAVGTTIEARNLFYNMPVRRRYLRSATTEFAHIQEAVARVALPCLDVAITLRHNGRTVYELPVTTNALDRIRLIYGSLIAERLIPVSCAHRNIAISGFVSSPDFSRKSATMQYLFINGRYFRDKALARALAEAYRGLLLPQQFPAAFLFIQTPLDFVDVNVHPTKQEVRFLDGQAMYASLLSGLREQFLRTDLASRPSGAELDAAVARSPQPTPNRPNAPASQTQTPSAEARLVPDLSPDDVAGALDPTAIDASQRKATEWLDQIGAQSQARKGEASDEGQNSETSGRETFEQANAELEDAARRRRNAELQADSANGLSKYESRPTNYTTALGGAPEFQKFPPIGAPRAVDEPKRDGVEDSRFAPGTFGGRVDAQLNDSKPLDDEERLDALRALVQANNSAILRANTATGFQVARDSQNRPVIQVCARYLVMESRDGLAIVDQHALHERILFEKLKANLEKGAVDSQTLMTPEPVDLTPTEHAFVLEKKDVFAKLGMDVDDFGGATIVIRSYPAILSDQSPFDCFGAVFQELEKRPTETELSDVMDAALKQMACKAAIKAGDRLRPDEIVELITLAEMEINAHHCPHGRPSVIILSCSEVDKLFKRT